jgi:hypothetical protein
MQGRSNPRRELASRSPVQSVVQNRDFEAFANGMDVLAARTRSIPGLLNVDTDLRVLGGRDVSRFTSDKKLDDVILRLDPGDQVEARIGHRSSTTMPIAVPVRAPLEA